MKKTKIVCRTETTFCLLQSKLCVGCTRTAASYTILLTQVQMIMLDSVGLESAQTMKKALILNGSVTEVPIILAAKTLGYETIVTGSREDEPGNKLADRYYVVDYSDYRRALEIAEQESISAVISCSNDFGAITAAYIAERMGLPGHDSFLLTKRLHEKDSFKEIAEAHNLPTLRGRGFSRLEPALEYLKNAEYPIIIKPVDLSGGKGITRVDTKEEAIAAVNMAFAASRQRHVVIEPFLLAWQHVLFGFLKDGKIQIAITADDHYLYNPFLASPNSSPALDEEPNRSIVIRAVERLASEMKLVDGFVEVQYMTDKTNGRVYIVEMMRRLPGNIALSALDKASSFSWTEWYFLSQAGEDCSRFYRSDYSIGCSSMISIMGEKNGIVREPFISDEIRKFIFSEVPLFQAGHEITNWNTERMEYLLCTFPNEEQMHRIRDHITDYVHMVYQ